MIRRIVNRCDAASDFLSVCRRVRRAMPRSLRRDPAQRHARRTAWSQAIRFHRANRELCAAVQF